MPTLLTRITLRIIVLALLPVLALAPAAYAQDVPPPGPPPMAEAAAPADAPACTPLDLIVLLDQSNSMTTTDPDNLRLDALQYAIDVLYGNAALRCPSVTHRFGAIGFGDDAQSLVPLAEGEISVPEVTDDAWETERDQLKTRIRPNQQGNTSLVAALTLAEQWFQAPAPAGSQGERARMVLIVTDGAPCTPLAGSVSLPELGGTSACQNPDWIAHYLLGNRPGFNRYNTPSDFEDAGFDFERGLNDFISTSPALRTSSFNVLLFTLPNQAVFVQPSTNDAWNQITSQHDGRYVPPTEIRGDLTQVTAVLGEIITPRIGVEREQIELFEQDGRCFGEFVLEPYSSSTTIIAATRPGVGAERQRVDLIQPNGELLPTQDITLGGSELRYQESRTIQSFTITNPAPGTWQISDPTGQCDVTATKEMIAVSVNPLPLPALIPVVAAPYYAEPKESNPNFLTLRLTDSLGNAFAQLDDYKLTITGTIGVEPANPLANVPLLAPLSFEYTGTDDAPGTWRATAPVPAPVHGRYTVTLVGTAPSAVDGNPPLDIFTAEATYETAAPVAVSVVVAAPEEGQVVPLNTLVNDNKVDAPFEVRVQFVDGAGQAQPIANIFPNEADRANAITVNLLPASAETASAAVRSLTLAPATGDAADPFSLVGTFQKPIGNNDADPEGEYQLTFAFTPAMQSGYNRENYVLPPLPAAVTISRREVRGVRVVPITPSADRQLLNTISGGVPTEQDIAVVAELVDDTGAPLPAGDAFTSDPNALVTATLIDPAGNTLDAITLAHDPAQPSRFTRTFVRTPISGADIGQTGDYQVQLAFAEGIDQAALKTGGPDDFAFLSPNARSIAFERRRVRGVQPVVVSVNGADAASGAPLRTALNTLDDSGGRTLDNVTVVAALADLTTGRAVYTGQELATFLPASVTALSATIIGPSGSSINETALLTRQPDGTFTGVLRNPDAFSSIDPAGSYAIDIELPPDVNLTDESIYVITGRRLAQNAVVERFLQRGLTIEPLVVGSVAVTEENRNQLPALELHYPLVYAFTGEIAPVQFTLRIRDTATGDSVNWETIIVPRPPDEAPPPLEATEETLAGATDQRIALVQAPVFNGPQAVSDVVVVGVRRAGERAFTRISNLTQVQSGTDWLITGEIVGINDGTPYELLFGLENNNLDPVLARSFNDFNTTPGQVNITRQVGSLLYSPLVWNVIKVISALLAGAVATYLIVVNVLWSMSGEMVVRIERMGGSTKEDRIPLGGFRLTRAKVGRNTGAKVSRTSAAKAARPGRGGLQPPTVALSKNQPTRVYEVDVQGRLVIVREGGDASMASPAGNIKAEHKVRTAVARPQPSGANPRRP